MKVGLDSDLMSFSRPIARHRNSASVKPAGITLPWSEAYQIKIRSKAAMIVEAAPSRYPQRTKMLPSLESLY